MNSEQTEPNEKNFPAIRTVIGVGLLVVSLRYGRITSSLVRNANDSTVGGLLFGSPVTGLITACTGIGSYAFLNSTSKNHTCNGIFGHLSNSIKTHW